MPFDLSALLSAIYDPRHWVKGSEAAGITLKNQAEALDQVSSRYFPGRRAKFGREETHFQRIEPGIQPKGIQTMKTALRAVSATWAQLFAALLIAESRRAEILRARVRRDGIKVLIQMVTVITREKIPLLKEVSQIFGIEAETEFWSGVEAEFRARAAMVRAWMVEHQPGRAKTQDPLPGENRTQTRRIYTRRKK